MTSHAVFWILMGVATAFAVVKEIARHLRLRRYWRRPCMGRAWRRRFPECPKADIRTFLAGFADAFGFRARTRLKFGPDDRVMDIYDTLHPPGSVTDDMELESFLLFLDDFRGEAAIEAFGPDRTLGDLFAARRERDGDDAPTRMA